jgi:hypothetical protein
MLNHLEAGVVRQLQLQQHHRLQDPREHLVQWDLLVKMAGQVTQVRMGLLDQKATKEMMGNLDPQDLQVILEWKALLVNLEEKVFRVILEKLDLLDLRVHLVLWGHLDRLVLQLHLQLQLHKV